MIYIHSQLITTIDREGDVKGTIVMILSIYHVTESEFPMHKKSG